MNIEQVPSYKTSDGVLHSSKHDAIKHEYRLELRGLIQAGSQTSLNKNDNFTATQVAALIANNSILMVKVMQKFNKAISKSAPKVSV